MVTRRKGPDPGQGPGFEESMQRLETIVEELEGGTLSLEDSIARYEEGVRLARTLTTTLDEAEKRIERLVEEGDEVGTEPMELAAPDDRDGELPLG